MEVKVRLFAMYREAAGSGALSWQIDEGTSVADLWRELQDAYPTLPQVPPAAAVNTEFAKLDATLSAGDEIAFLPPVSGGATREADMFKIVKEPISERQLQESVEDPGAGAICTFLGVVRDNNLGREVDYLEYEAYPEMAVPAMKRIADEIREHWDVINIAIVHRVGRLEIREASVGIAVSSPHRAESFEACRYAIDRLKESVPIWKKEVWTDGEEWIEGTVVSKQ